MIVKTKHGHNLDLDTDRIIRAISVLQKLAPPDLRGGVDELDELYELKRRIKAAIEYEQEILIEEEISAKGNGKEIKGTSQEERF